MTQASSNQSQYRTSRTLTDAHKRQIEILQVMAEHISSQGMHRQFEISELCNISTIKDEKEMTRYLLILEGQKLVSPYPEGNFTSSRWILTKEGSKAIRMFTRPTVQ
jgi:hypothetical protein